MFKLFIFNMLILLVIVLLLAVCKKYIKNEKWKNNTLLISSVVTILLHYSSFIFFFITGKANVIEYLSDNPNLILPIYPCNIVMWSALIFGINKKKDSKFGLFLSDYLFWFGMFSTLVGMFLNVDFINDPTFKNYEVTKSILAHATLLFNVLLIYVFGYVKIDLRNNIKHIFYSIILMFVIGIYCNLVFTVLVSKERAYDINSMFILHSPFEGIPFLIYPFIAIVSLVLYYIVFKFIEIIKRHKKELLIQNN